MASKKDKDLSKKTFNAVAGGLFRELGKLFPGDVKLAFLSGELEKFSKEKKDAHVPAIKFFKALNGPSGLPSLAAPTEIAPVGELIINKDERLFTNAEASIPDLDAIDFKGKWTQLSSLNKAAVWSYLDRMATLSAQVATLEALNPEDILKLSQLVGHGQPADVSRLMQDPSILELSKKIGERMAQ